ncbi:MAG: DUF87 domain-containing protein [Clostridiales bacterium]|nr:DUF87 domain-containing protein [Clostridiales bacterium]
MLKSKQEKILCIIGDIHQSVFQLRLAKGEYKLDRINNVRKNFDRFEVFRNKKPISSLFNRKKMQSEIEEQVKWRKKTFEYQIENNEETLERGLKVLLRPMASWHISCNIEYVEYQIIKITLNRLLDVMEEEIKSSITINTIIDHDEIFEDKNCLVIGRAGSGKTVFNKVMFRNSIAKKIKGILVIDEEKEFIKEFSDATLIDEINVDRFKYFLHMIEDNYILSPENFSFPDIDIEDYIKVFDNALEQIKYDQINHIVADSDRISLYLELRREKLNKQNIYCTYNMQSFSSPQKYSAGEVLLSVAKGFILSELDAEDKRILDSNSNQLLYSRHRHHFIRGEMVFRYSCLKEFVFSLHRCHSIHKHNRAYMSNMKILSKLKNEKWYHFIGKYQDNNNELYNEAESFTHCLYCGEKLA